MKKLSFTLFIIVFLVLFNFNLLKMVDNYIGKEIDGRYTDRFSFLRSSDKNKNFILHNEASKREDNLFLFGSSELATVDIFTNPIGFFNKKQGGFVINPIGTGHSQSLIHSIDILSIINNLKGKKIVFIISPQWFSPKGLEPIDFEMNFSSIQFYNLLFNASIDKGIKKDILERVHYLTKDSSNYGEISLISGLYTKDSIVSKVIYNALLPYYRYKFYLLSIKDKLAAKKMLDKYNNGNIEDKKIDIKWEDVAAKANSEGKRNADNNEFRIENNYYNTYIKDKLDSLKGIYKEDSFLNSPEYDDLDMLLRICKEYDIEPLFINVPVNGFWYDYAGFSRKDRQDSYKKIADTIKKYNFRVVDYSGYEYEEYFLKDIMHLGWKGWADIDEQIYKFYNEY